jgi:ATP-dependent Clp protease ATP-binding subunit ClpC
VKVEEPSVEDAIKILRGLKSKYEMHHKARFTEKAIVAAVELSSRYLPSRFLPDKAIDIMDEAGSKARIAAMTRPPELKGIEEEIEAIRIEKEEAIREQDFEKAAALRDNEKQAKKRFDSLLETWRNASQEKTVDVDDDEIMSVIAKWTGVPLQRMETAEAEKLLKMETELKSRVIGQEEAVIAISKALRRSRADLKDPRRPIGSFLFLGPTGVGKTFLAKNLAEFMFGSADALIQLDMSEYMEKHTASRLIGAPPGYVGYEEGGQLSEAVRRRPYSVVLFDEVEKAHPDVMHLLLQILEEGQVTDNFGRKIDFRNTIVILTSNVGAETIKRQTSLGFGAMTQDENASHEGIKGKIGEQAKKFFKPEFLNRLDDIVVFRMLEKTELTGIVDLEVGKVLTRLRNKKIELVLDQTARDFLIKEGYDPQYGARPMRRAVEKHIEDPLAEHVLRGDVKPGDRVQVIANEDGKALKFTTDARPEETPEPAETTDAA